MLPEAGDIAWFEFDPVRGTEQAGRRPGLILTSREYHQRSGRAVVCPISSRGDAWPFNVPLPLEIRTRGFVMTDQVRTLERSGRMFNIIERIPTAVLNDVRGRLAALLGIDFVGSIAAPAPE
jgi:mRNA interferase MazF